MTPTPTKTTPPPEGSLEFEITDFQAARQALDELPEGLQAARSLRPNVWEAKRRPKLPTDRALVGRTMDWLLTLPAEARPSRLADSTPRIANAIAEQWDAPERALAYLDDLLTDRRGGRRGLPLEVKQEVEALRRLLVARGADG